MTNEEINKILFTVKAIKTHEDCVNNGDMYNVIAETEHGYDIFPDSYGDLSHVHKSYFESQPPLANVVKKG